MAIGISDTYAAGVIDFFQLIAANESGLALVILPSMLLWIIISCLSFWLIREFYYMYQRGVVVAPSNAPKSVGDLNIPVIVATSVVSEVAASGVRRAI